jgi:hypothetical protein
MRASLVGDLVSPADENLNGSENMVLSRDFFGYLMTGYEVVGSLWLKSRSHSCVNFPVSIGHPRDFCLVGQLICQATSHESRPLQKSRRERQPIRRLGTNRRVTAFRSKPSPDHQPLNTVRGSSFQFFLINRFTMTKGTSSFGKRHNKTHTVRLLNVPLT